jgi:hypothetical protein
MVGSLAKPAHGDRVTAGLTERRRKDFDDPETQRNRGHFADQIEFALPVDHIAAPLIARSPNRWRFGMTWMARLPLAAALSSR